MKFKTIITMACYYRYEKDVAAEFGVDQTTVNSWRNRSVLPNIGHSDALRRVHLMNIRWILREPKRIATHHAYLENSVNDLRKESSEASNIRGEIEVSLLSTHRP